MKPSRFNYYAVDSIDAAISLIAQQGEDARFLAGGQSLVPMMNFRVAAPTALIDLNGVPELSNVRIDDDGALHIGAMARMRQLETDPEIAEANPLIAVAAACVAHTQIRNRGTIGGSLAHADPAAELPGIALVCDAEVHLRGLSGARVIEAAKFFDGVFTTALADGELIEKLYFPPWPEHRRWAFQEISRREGDFALVGVAAWFDLDESGTISDCRLAAIGAGDTPLLLDSPGSDADRVGTIGRIIRESCGNRGRRHRTVRRHPRQRRLPAGGRRGTSRQDSQDSLGAQMMSDRHNISLNVNGADYSCEIDARMTLADCLREKLDLTGTHLGCEHGVCGACTVLADGDAVRSCLMFAVQAQCMEITTVEGLANNGDLSPLQEAFRDNHALQCGFLHPGNADDCRGISEREPVAHPGGDRKCNFRQSLPLHRIYLYHRCDS